METKFSQIVKLRLKPKTITPLLFSLYLLLGCEENEAIVEEREVKQIEINDRPSKEIESDTILNDLVDLGIFKFNPD